MMESFGGKLWRSEAINPYGFSGGDLETAGNGRVGNTPPCTQIERVL
jgi:hypothetical protein